MKTLLTKTLATAGATLALSMGVAGTAEAAPAKDVSYSYQNEFLIDNDNPLDTGYYVVTGGVKYTAKNGGPITYCNYYRIPPGGDIFDAYPEGYYNIRDSSVLTDTSSESVRQHCLSNFNNRTEVDN